MAGGYFIGLDLGTSGMKAVALGTDGAVAARAHSPYPTAHPAPLAAEQDPAHWLAAMGAVLAELAASVATSRWAAIGLSGMLPTLVTLDETGRPNGPAITWEDARAEPQAERMRELLGAGHVYEETGQWLDGRYLVAMFRRIVEQEPARAAKTGVVCSAKDYLFLSLTGELATDPSTAAGYGCYGLAAGAFSPRLRSAIVPRDMESPQLPPVLGSSTVLPLADGAVTGIPAGLAVCLGGADSVVGALGLGVEAEGDVAYIAGTSTVIIGRSSRLRLDAGHRFLVTPMAEEGAFGLEMDLLSTGSSMSWLARLLLDASSPEAIGVLASGVDPADAPVFLPFLAGGEQGALWEPDLRGSVVGLERDHGRAHIARGLMNGIVLESRRCLGVLEEAGLPAGTVHLAGRAADVPGFAQDLADASGRAVRFSASKDADASALGAAVLAARAAGAGRDREDSAVCGAPAPASRLLEPDPGRAPLWDRLFDRHESALSRLRDFDSKHFDSKDFDSKYTAGKARDDR